MTEPPAAALLPAAASERDVLLATKLHVPGSRRTWCRGRG